MGLQCKTNQSMIEEQAQGNLLGQRTKQMRPTIWKAYKTESAAHKYVIKLNSLGITDAHVEQAGGLYLVVNCLFKLGA